jgi:hypothetical protein
MYSGTVAQPSRVALTKVGTGTRAVPEDKAGRELSAEWISNTTAAAAAAITPTTIPPVVSRRLLRGPIATAVSATATQATIRRQPQTGSARRPGFTPELCPNRGTSRLTVPFGTGRDVAGFGRI